MGWRQNSASSSDFESFPKNFNRYHEPFVGGGAVFFNLQPNKAILSDVNPDLIQAYQMIRDDVDSVIAELKQHRAEEAYYYSVRETDVAELSAAEAAARIIFLNKTCFNGLYRVNRRGKFNVPFGKYANPTICNEKNLRAVSDALQGVDIRLQSVFELDARVKKNDLVYFDPPYVPVSLRPASLPIRSRGSVSISSANWQISSGGLFRRVHIVF